MKLSKKAEYALRAIVAMARDTAGRTFSIQEIAGGERIPLKFLEQILLVLKNGGILPPGGITVATDNPCYIQGDYNTGTVGATQPNSNQTGGDPTQNAVPGYEVQSCAVLADAVMILQPAMSPARSRGNSRISQW